jgi:hypothetical protein
VNMPVRQNANPSLSRAAGGTCVIDDQTCERGYFFVLNVFSNSLEPFLDEQDLPVVVGVFNEHMNAYESVRR